jgi:hypothetical protein
MRESERQPWERRAGETARAYRAFACFRDLGEDRTIVQAAKLLGKSESLLRRWSARHDWWSRVQSWDLENEREERAAARRARAKSLRWRRQIAQQVQQLGMLGLSGLVQRDPVTGKVALVRELKPREAAALLAQGVELEDGLVPAVEEAAAGDDSVAAVLHRKPDAVLQQLLEHLEPHAPTKEAGDDVKE